ALAPLAAKNSTIVPLLRGAAIFGADMMRALARRNVHPELDFLWLESYHGGRQSAGRVMVRADIAAAVDGRSIILLDDVYDSGRTLDFAVEMMRAKGAASITTCALVLKPAPPDAPPNRALPDLHGFEAPAEFLIGYGMDDGGLYRGLPYIGAVKT
ncbi:MAG: phosphoribosyltransferase family protein, partial [Caulobacterales bacterium]